MTTPEARPPAEDGVSGVSIRDVARLAGVSHQTVSRVLNDHPSVRPATRERVRTVIAELGYTPSRAARSLSMRRSGVIGILATSSAEYGPASCIQAIETAARSHGYTVSVADTGGIGPTEVRSSLDHLLSQQIEALAVIAPHGEALTAVETLPRALPRVMLQAPGHGTHPGLAVDQAAGVGLAVAHLLELGHTSIAHIAGPSDWLDATARAAAFGAALDAAGLAPAAILEGDWSAGSGYRIGLELAARRHITAVFSSNDQMALGLLHALHEGGVRVPDDISVVGFDDIPEAAHFWPPLTTVRQDFAELGRRCVDRLLGLDADGPSVPIAPLLIPRRSTAPLP
ncbi:LacI family transcriptional regulator [Cnuibacter physcomitrellae]|uniref:Uncharacterized protein n=1 Tax=Cnuibacter physcomitrellae TaxID=1619308 RepID=A0A1X9LNQ0_9MICO|nr:LacI family DNA-binding transcriptional regulator [Cnuibacter physcomitrellae]ARJ06816.1 hypothetical protein B5808_17505 [Cnuibacter physcomitrellae]GGI38902.1 LacI family transcriptional regulator [Cnuibacter physcomitrellae]